MQITNKKYTVLTAEPGFYLTQVQAVELHDRIFSKKLYLGKYDSPENYTEITEAEAEKLMEELDQLRILLENPEKQEN